MCVRGREREGGRMIRIGFSKQETHPLEARRYQRRMQCRPQCQCQLEGCGLWGHVIPHAIWGGHYLEVTAIGGKLKHGGETGGPQSTGLCGSEDHQRCGNCQILYDQSGLLAACRVSLPFCVHLGSKFILWCMCKNTAVCAIANNLSMPHAVNFPPY